MHLQWLLCLLLTSVVTAIFIPHTPLRLRRDQFVEGEPVKVPFDWRALEASSQLQYTPCYDIYECTRLSVPLEYDVPTNNTVELAIVRVPAKVPVTDPSFGGTILVNPGGPGGSGVDLVKAMGKILQTIVDSDKHFEILSWDPRGVARTTPSLSCFASDRARQIWLNRGRVVGDMRASELSFNRRWVDSQGFGMLCHEAGEGVYPDGSNIRQYVSTALVARDMISIIDAVQAERNERVLSGQGASGRQQISEDGRPALLKYWGLSYGTHLGATFVSLFPHRSSAIILDANVDSSDYMAGGWLTNLQDNNRTMDFFYEYCFEAGFKCQLYDNRTANSGDIKIKVDRLLIDLENSPLPVVYNGTTDFVSFYDVASLIHMSSYMPNKYWRELAEILADLTQGNTTSILPKLELLQDQDPDITHSNGLSSTECHPRPVPTGHVESLEETQTVVCGDGESLTHLNKTEWRARLDILHTQSPVVAQIWAEVPTLCLHWNDSLRPAARNRFAGPFGANISDLDVRAVSPLIIGNIADPVTPLANARKMAGLFEGSRLLVQNTPGHGSTMLNPSKCTAQHIKRFFGHGILPPEGTVCEGDHKPWDIV